MFDEDTYLDTYEDSSWVPFGAVVAYLDNQWQEVTPNNVSEQIGNIAGEYLGEFATQADINEFLVDRFYDLTDTPEYIRPFVDTDYLAKNEREDYTVLGASGAWYLFQN